MSSENSFNLGDNLNDDGLDKKNSSVMNLIYKIPRKLRIVSCIVIVTGLIIFMLNAFKPEARKRPIPETVVNVETITAELGSYPIVVNANGTVEAETRGDLVAQIRGEIVAVSNNFKTGGSFKKGDLLIQLDQRDYQAELSRALANLSQADAAYRQEKATAKQARTDWQRLGNTSPAPDLVLRKPQLTAAKAQYDSAKAAYDTAELNLSRTAITAPYDGRIIERRAVLGQYVAIGSPIAEVFATNGVEVRLPISQEEFSQLGLDSFNSSGDSSDDYLVAITSSVGNQGHQWDAKITRTDSTFDINTRQIDVIAEVQDPFGRKSGQPALKIGQFVSARIQGRTINNVYVIPNKSVREGSYVYVVRDGKLAKQSINIMWQDDQNALVTKGIEANELVVTTSLNSTLAGASAKLADEGKQEAAPANETDAPALEAATAEPQKSETLGDVIETPEPSNSDETSKPLNTDEVSEAAAEAPASAENLESSNGASTNSSTNQ